MIYTDPSARLLALHTTHTSYWMGVDETGRLLHLYYGPLREDPARVAGALFRPRRPPRPPAAGMAPAPAWGTTTRRFLRRNGPTAPSPPRCALPGVKTRAGQVRAAGAARLPHWWRTPGAETLRITLKDGRGLTLTLLYGVLPGCDVITRAAVLENTGEEPVTLRGMPSAVLDFARSAHPALDFITFDGAWAAERTPCRAAVRPGVQAVGSVGGIPHPCAQPVRHALHARCRRGPRRMLGRGACVQRQLPHAGRIHARGRAAFGGHRAVPLCLDARTRRAVHCPRGRVRLQRRGFRADEPVLPPRHPAASAARPLGGHGRAAPPCCSTAGKPAISTLTRPSCCAWPPRPKRPGATCSCWTTAGSRGRNDDTSSLGDWVADPAKLPEGIDGLCRKVNDLGLAFGLWVEPEAVNPDSDLYRAHPDWALQIPGRETLALRHQYTLDFSRADVREGVWRQLTALLDSCPVAYVKWDMNRTLANVYSAALPAARQGEVYHRYVLGVYELQQRLTDRYPDLLLENCAGGGARFDCGMLYYSPQIWTSDNTDALDRLMIQYGTSFCYPPCVMGAHYSTVPNHTTHRTASVEARMAAALAGTFGFELDLTAYTAAEIEALHPFVQFYRDHGALVRGGELYRLAAPDGQGAAWAIAAADGGEAVVFAVGAPLDGRRLPLPFADPARRYAVHALYTGSAPQLPAAPLPGETLLEQGLPLPALSGVLPGYVAWLQSQEE